MSDFSANSTILVVENNRLNLELLLSILKKHNYTLIAARNGYEALARSRENTPDLILMDVQMPDMDGFDTAIKLKQNKELQHIPVLFTSTFTDSANILKCFESGGVDYISKPYKDKELLARIHTHISIKKLREQLQTDHDHLISILQNMLPEGVIRTLQSGSFPKPESVDNAAVLFTDFKNFSLLTKKIDSKQSVDHLNLIYYAFDEIVNSFGLERIKTIGDAYFAVGGINTKPTNLYLSPVLAAIKMQEFVSYYNSTLHDITWQLRIGITVGPVTSGVIGYQKIAYDVWGDTVNLANRLQQEAQPGFVSMKAVDYNRIRNYIELSGQNEINSASWGKLDIVQCNSFTESLPATHKEQYLKTDPAVLLEQASSMKSLLNKIFQISGKNGI